MDGVLHGEKANPLKIALVVEVAIVVAADVDPASAILIILLPVLSAVVAYTIAVVPEKSATTPLAPTVERLPVPSV